MPTRAKVRVEPRRRIVSPSASPVVAGEASVAEASVVPSGGPSGSGIPPVADASCARPSTAQRRAVSPSGRAEAPMAAQTSGSSTSRVESGSDASRSGWTAGAAGGGGAPVPTGTRTRLASRPASSPRRASTAVSAKPRRRRVGMPRATAVARRLARRVPASQKKWR